MGGGVGAERDEFGFKWRCSVCNFTNHSLMEVCEQCDTRKTASLARERESGLETKADDTAEETRAAVESKLFCQKATVLQDHLNALMRDGVAGFMESIRSLWQRNITITAANKSRALAVLWAAGARAEVDELLFDTAGFADVVVVLKWVQLLDGRRHAKQQRRKLNRLTAVQERTPHQRTVRRFTLNALTTAVHNLEREGMDLPADATGVAAAAKAPSTGAKTAPAAAEGGAAASAVAGGAGAGAGAGGAGDLEGAPHLASFTSSAARRVRRWVQQQPVDLLEHTALLLSLEPWKELCDLAHLRPDDFKLPFFQQLAFGAEAPADSVVARVKTVEGSGLVELLEAEPRAAQFFSYLRTNLAPMATTLDNAAKAALARHAALADLLWYHDDVACPEVDAIIVERLSAGEDITDERNTGRANFAKLMEKLLVFNETGAPFAKLLLPYAEQRLAAITLPRSALNVAVLGDASGSMEVAVRAATILGGLVSVVLNADITFFRGDAVRASIVPRTAADVLAVTREVKAMGRTSPAAALRHYVDRRERIDLLVVVSDEEENGTDREGLDFAQLFLQYREHVHAGCKVFFVSFLNAGVTAGRMQTKLRRMGVPVQSMIMDRYAPDLTKFDNLLGMLTLETASFGARGAPIEGPEAGATGASGGAGATITGGGGGGSGADTKGAGASGGAGAGAATASDATVPAALAAEVARLKAELEAVKAAMTSGTRGTADVDVAENPALDGGDAGTTTTATASSAAGTTASGATAGGATDGGGDGDEEMTPTTAAERAGAGPAAPADGQQQP